MGEGGPRGSDGPSYWSPRARPNETVVVDVSRESDGCKAGGPADNELHIHHLAQRTGRTPFDDVQEPNHRPLAGLEERLADRRETQVVSRFNIVVADH